MFGKGGYLPLAPGVSTVRYPIPQRTFKYLATVQSVTDETCHFRTLSTLAEPIRTQAGPAPTFTATRERGMDE